MRVKIAGVAVESCRDRVPGVALRGCVARLGGKAMDVTEAWVPRVTTAVLEAKVIGVAWFLPYHTIISYLDVTEAA